jgi:hypothetical protein
MSAKKLGRGRGALGWPRQSLPELESRSWLRGLVGKHGRRAAKSQRGTFSASIRRKSNEPNGFYSIVSHTTLVQFRLEAVPEGTLLTIVESGFDRVPAHRRERAFRMNESGWQAQTENVKKYVEKAA